MKADVLSGMLRAAAGSFLLISTESLVMILEN